MRTIVGSHMFAACLGGWYTRPTTARSPEKAPRMSENDRNYLTDALLDALQDDEGSELRARGGADGVQPAYYLQEFDVPVVEENVERHTANVAALGRGASSAAQVSEPPIGGGVPDADADGSAIVCPNCNATNAAAAKYCSSCGFQLRSVLNTDSSVSSITNVHRATATLRVVLVSINEDGSDGPRIELRYSDSVVGRAGDIRFPTDAFLSPKHARFSIEGERLYIEDLYSLNGTYVKLREETRLTPGDTFLMGRQVLRFEKFEHTVAPKARASDGTRYMGSPPPSGHFKLIQVGIGGITQNVYCLHETGAVIGREKGDIIFPRDKFMSGRHAQIFPRDDGHYYLMDLSSSNGTWVKIWERRSLVSGDFAFLGQQLFRVEVG